MGHMHPEELSKLTIKQIYAKGNISIRELIAHAKKKGIPVSCSEGTYDDDGMYSYAFEVILLYHYDSTSYMNLKNLYAKIEGIRTVEPIIETEKDKEVLNKFFSCGSEEEWEHLVNIKWKFSENGRKRYLDKKIVHIDSFTN